MGAHSFGKRLQLSIIHVIGLFNGLLYKIVNVVSNSFEMNLMLGHWG